MAQVTLNIPDDFVSNQADNAEGFAHRLQLAAAIYWYAHGEISQGKAAQLAGMNRKEFLERLADENMDVFQVDVEDVAQELALG
jgi:predicted HTH domain antitoxin